jgi:hypothetical protein
MVNSQFGRCFLVVCNASGFARGSGKNRSANSSALPLWLFCVPVFSSLRRSGGIVVLSGDDQLFNLAQRSSLHKFSCLCALAAIARFQLLDFAFFTVFITDLAAC